MVANRLLWRLGLRDVLPRYYVQRIPVKECGEPLDPIPAVPGRLLLDPRLRRPHLARRSVTCALRDAADLLPNDVQLLIVEAYRSPALQQKLWSAAREEIVGKHPLATPSEIDRLTSLIVARPSKEGGGHQTGAAVDLTLADAAGTELWMGTGVGEFAPATPARAHVTDTVSRRRRLLTRCLTEVGFINYPAEWWHFSMGDRLWAAYGRRPEARFGPCTVGESSLWDRERA
ncbi:MAG: M15 family metallopeptidase [Pseudonocardiaceae bacterium]